MLNRRLFLGSLLGGALGRALPTPTPTPKYRSYIFGKGVLGITDLREARNKMQTQAVFGGFSSYVAYVHPYVTYDLVKT